MIASQELRALPVGVALRPLDMRPDQRGVFTEVFRESWDTRVVPIQWNVVRSEAGVLRGVHVHVVHDDYLTVLAGRAIIALRDLRRGAPTEGQTAAVELTGDPMAALVIPRGVAHAFYFPERALHLYAVSEYWNPADELGCHWADPELELPWQVGEGPLVSERDAGAVSLRLLVEQLEPFQPIR